MLDSSRATLTVVTGARTVSVRLAGRTLSVLPPPMLELLPHGSMCEPSQTHLVPLSLNATPYVPCTIPDPLRVDAVTQEPKAGLWHDSIIIIDVEMGIYLLICGVLGCGSKRAKRVFDRVLEQVPNGLRVDDSSHPVEHRVVMDSRKPGVPGNHLEFGAN